MVQSDQSSQQERNSEEKSEPDSSFFVPKMFSIRSRADCINGFSSTSSGSATESFCVIFEFFFVSSEATPYERSEVQPWFNRCETAVNRAVRKEARLQPDFAPVKSDSEAKR